MSDPDKRSWKQWGREQHFPPHSQQINVTRSLLSPQLGTLHQATGDRLQAARGAPSEGGAPKNASLGTQTRGGRSSGAPKSIREKICLGLRGCIGLFPSCQDGSGGTEPSLNGNNHAGGIPGETEPRFPVPRPFHDSFSTTPAAWPSQIPDLRALPHTPGTFSNGVPVSLPDWSQQQVPQSLLGWPNHSETSHSGLQAGKDARTGRSCSSPAAGLLPKAHLGWTGWLRMASKRFEVLLPRRAQLPEL